MQELQAIICGLLSVSTVDNDMLLNIKSLHNQTALDKPPSLLIFIQPN